MDEVERYSDPIDAGCARAEQWLSDKLAEAHYQLVNAVNSYPVGRCRNCAEKTDDGRTFCDSDCAIDFEIQQKADRRNAKYRGG